VCGGSGGGTIIIIIIIMIIIIIIIIIGSKPAPVQRRPLLGSDNLPTSKRFLTIEYCTRRLWRD
jgi:hypothetical protein